MKNTTLIDACYLKKTKHTPVWFMRQAGRYLPEYKKIKKNRNILDIVKTPELAARISLSPIEVLKVDAAILYADIMIPLLGIGVDLEIVENIGPVIHKPIKTTGDVKRLRELTPEKDIPYLSETIKILRGELKVPLIGFSAAPFTLASYIIEGGPTRDFIKTKSLMYQDKQTWDLLMEKLTQIIIVYLKFQITSGVQVIQLFDSWVGALSERDYVEYVSPYTKSIFDSIKHPDIPTIHFGTNTAAFLSAFSEFDCNVISIDFRQSIFAAWEKIGYEKAIQGNLDPVLLLSDFKFIKKRVDDIFNNLPQKEGYIFNLGHGVLPVTPVKNLIKLTEYIHSL